MGMKYKDSREKGISLVEVLISIIILAMVMVPLMSNFIRSMKISRDAKALQVQNNITANIMEGFKSYTMSETLEQFYEPTEGLDLIPFQMITDSQGNPIANEVTRLKWNEVDNVFEAFPSLEEGDTYYFGIHGIEEGGTRYDALITMDSLVYRTEETNTMNNYPIPNIINLDEKTNGLLVSNPLAGSLTMDQIALDTFTQKGFEYRKRQWELSTYQDYLRNVEEWRNRVEEARIKNLPMPTPIEEPAFNPNRAENEEYCIPAKVRQKITKTMMIKVKDNYLTYQIDYRCQWPLDAPIENKLTYNIVQKYYSDTLENIYLFYTPSIFQLDSTGSLYDSTKPDEIKIVNEAMEKRVNFYIAKQKDTMSVEPYIKIFRDSFLDNINTFTNLLNDYDNVKMVIEGLEQEAGFTPGVIETAIKNRIYTITVDLYKYVEGEPKDKYIDKLYTLKSTREK